MSGAGAWHECTLAELARGVRDGAYTSVALTEYLLARVDALDPVLNSFVTVDAERALAAARAADARRGTAAAGPLNGVPIAHKDIFCTDGLRTTCGSRMLADFVPPYDAAAVERLAAAGCVTLGKTNMDEFAMGSSNETSWFGPVKNPWDTSRVPGGSSGGSAAAVAARLVPAATGTDTGGSIRQPAALTGTTGLKPTYGRVSRWGMIAFASSLDQAGTLTRTAEDAALMLAAMAGLDPRDSTSVDAPVPDYVAALAYADVRGLRLGVPGAFFDQHLDAGIGRLAREAIAVLESGGAKIVEVELPNLHLAIPVYYVVAPAEASSNLSRFDGVRFGHRAAGAKDLLDLYERSRSEGFGDEVKRRIMTGTYVLSAGYFDAYYLKAQQVRALIARDFERAFEQADLIVGPTAPTPAFALGAKTDDPVTMYLNDIYTVGAPLAGLPAISVPCGLHEDLPAGLQLIGPHFSEDRLLAAAHWFQQRTDWHRQAPALAAEAG